MYMYDFIYLLFIIYLESGRSPIPTLYVVSAGSEDLEFVNLFPYWRDNPDIVKQNNVSIDFNLQCACTVNIEIK